MIRLLRLGMAAGLAVAFAAAGPSVALPGGAGGEPGVAPLAGILTGAVLAAPWLGVGLALAVVAAAALADVLGGGAVAPWVIVVLAPLLAVATARLRHAQAGRLEAVSDPLEILGVAAGSALVAAALAGAFALPGGPLPWAVAVGLGVLVAAPPLARALQLLARPAACPLAAARAPAPALVEADGEAEEKRPGLRILVVEDDAVNRLVALEILRGAGHSVVSSADGLEGLSRASTEEQPFDAILLDLHMPGLDGIDVLGRIRALPDSARARVPVLLLSADVTAAARRRGMEAGADAFLTKPVEAPALLEALEALGRGRPVPVQADAGAAVDLDLLEGRLGDLGGDSLGRILGLFQDAAPRHLARLRDHAAHGDAAAVKREAHTLKGAAAVIGAGRVCEAAGEIERAAGDAASVAAGLARLDAVVTSTQMAVEAFARRRRIPLAPARGRERQAPQETSGANT